MNGADDDVGGGHGKTDVVDAAYRAHFSEILLFICSRVQCDLTSQDLAQDVFVKFSRAAGRDHIVNPRAFLYRTAKNVIIDHYRSEKARPQDMVDVFDMKDDLSQDAPSVEQRFIFKQTLASLLGQVRAMPSLRRSIITLYFLREERQADIARTLNICQSTVEKNIHRAREQIHATIGPL